MSEFLFYYHPVEPSTWYYLSSLLTIGLFFKFSRLWSVRNLDLALLIMLGPGLLFVYYGRQMDDGTLARNGRVPRNGTVQVLGQASSGEQTAGADQPPSPTAATVNLPSAATQLNEGDDLDLPPSDRLEEPDVQLPGQEYPENSSAGDVGNAARPMTDGPSEAINPGAAIPGAAIPGAGDGGPTGALDSEDDWTTGQRTQKYGYMWLFFAGFLVVVRLLADPTMVRRPLLEPNLSAGGLTFIGCSLFVFLMANVISRPADDLAGPELGRVQTDVAEANPEERVTPEPGYALLARLPSVAKKILVVLAHLAIVLGMVFIGYWHFDNIIMGVGAATLYLMLPYTVLMTSQIKHAVPAACLVWAVLCYRRPLAAGAFLGLAGGMSYYPLFLLPLWLSFYWPRGLWRFSLGVFAMLVLLLFVLFSSADVLFNIRLMFGLIKPAMANLRGIWDESLGGWNIYYRIPMLAAFIALAGSMALWPAQKNLGTLLSCSAAVMAATQFWHGYGGGLYMAWYLPMLLLTIFRPNLEDRVALTVLAEGWLPRRLIPASASRAA